MHDQQNINKPIFILQIRQSCWRSWNLLKFRHQVQWSALPEPHQPLAHNVHLSGFLWSSQRYSTKHHCNPKPTHFKIFQPILQVIPDLLLVPHGLHISSPTSPVACFQEPNNVMHLVIGTVHKLEGCILYNFNIFFHRSKFILIT